MIKSYYNSHVCKSANIYISGDLSIVNVHTYIQNDSSKSRLTDILYLAKINEQYFMLEDFYMEILAEFNIVVNDHCLNNYKMHNIMLSIKLYALL